MHVSVRGSIPIVCGFCGKNVARYPSEISRNQKRGHKTFCDRKCSFANRKSLLPEQTKFNVYILRAHKSPSSSECNIDSSYLLWLWNEQNGICPITGWKLILQNSSGSRMVGGTYKRVTTHHASLDRIDPNKGYIKGNVRFISIMANYAKHTWGDDDLIEFCKAVADNAV